MQTLKFRNLWLMAVAVILAVTMGSCLGNDDANNSLGTPEQPILTGLCDNAWEIDSIGSNPAKETEYQKIIFSIDGTGRHTSYNTEKEELQTTTFTWKSYLYSGSVHTIVMHYEGFDYPAQMFYTILSNQRLRFAGDNTYYQFKALPL